MALKAVQNWTRTFQARTSKGFPPRGGFSFIEMMIVMALLGVMMFLAVPTFQVLLESGVDREITRLTNVIRLTRNQAVLTQKGYRLVWVLKKREYWVEQRTGFNEYVPATDHKLFSSHVLSSAFDIPEIIVMGDSFTQLRDEKALVYIDPSGFLDQFLIHFTEDEKPWTLKVMGFSARMRLVEGHVDFSETDQ